MLRKIFILLIFVFAANMGLAQRFYGVTIAGLNGTQVTGDNLVGYNKAGIAAGLGAGYMLSPKVALQMEMLFMQKGSFNNDSIANTDSLTLYKMKLAYMEVPLMLNYIQKKLVIQAGFSLGYLLSSSEENTYGDIQNEVPFKRSEIAIQLGAQYKLYKALHLNWRFGYSLASIHGYAPARLFRFNEGQYNSVMSFTLRYYLGSADAFKQ